MLSVLSVNRSLIWVSTFGDRDAKLVAMAREGGPEASHVDATASAAGAVAAAVHLKLPPFWPADPDVWFAQVEAQFNTRGITLQKTKYDYVVASLSPEYATEVRDLILTVPDHPYDTLKRQLIQRTCLPEQRRIHRLVHSLELGDHKPTQLLRRMQQLLGSSATAAEGPLLRELFLQRLPANVRLVLASSIAGKSLEEIAQLADSVIDIAPPHLSAITPPSTEMESLRAEIKELKELVSTLAPRSRSPRPRSPSPSLRRHRLRFQSPPPPATLTTTLCWYHRRFGDRARNCTPPCDHPGNDKASR